jgi:hypothetical protein
MPDTMTLESPVDDETLDFIYDRCDGGFLDIYDDGRSTKIARLQLGNPAFAAASGGSKVAEAIGSSAALPAAGLGTAPAEFTLCKSDGTIVASGTVGTSGSGAILIVSASPIVAGTTVAVSSLTLTGP